MLKEKMNNAKEFVKEHKKEIIIGAVGTAVIAALGYKVYKDRKIIVKGNADIDKLKDSFEEASDIAEEALTDDIELIDLRIFDIRESINRLDPNENINKFHRIPERERAIELLVHERSNKEKSLDRVRNLKP